jgi:hypothetical protein
MPSIIKYELRSKLEPLGWTGMTTGKIIPSYCANCQVQRQHRVTGEARRENDTLFRLECEHCRARLDGRGVMQ